MNLGNMSNLARDWVASSMGSRSAMTKVDYWEGEAIARLIVQILEFTLLRD